MKKETQLLVDSSLHGLMYVSELIDKALLGEKRGMNAHNAEHDGPLALALHRIGEIADGAPVLDREEAYADMSLAFDMLYHLRGGFYSGLWELLDRAHLLVAERITEQEAKHILGDDAIWLSMDARLGHIHPIERKADGTWRTFDATFLGEPLGEVFYARYEIEARQRHYAEYPWKKK